MTRKNKNYQKDFEKIIDKNKSPSKRRVKISINELKIGDYYRGDVKIIRKVKPGPLILEIFDGTSTIDAVAHNRFFKNKIKSNKNSTYNYGNLKIKDNRPKKKKTDEKKKKSKSQNLEEDEIHEGDIVKIFGKVGSHRNRLELEIKSIKSSSLDFEYLLQTRSRPLRDIFSIDSERYEKMKPRFIEIAQRIRRAIIDQQPILLRHHNDADGICSGLAVEQAIINVMDKFDIKKKNKIYRSPSVSPFYDQIDLFRDISKFNRYTKIFGDPSPLVILLDTGSTPENQFVLQVLQSFNFECIIVDHHNPGTITDGKSAVCKYLQFHLNPYLFGWDSQTSGGMLAYELARFIDEEYENSLYPAVAGLADRCDIPEVTALIENTGKTREELGEMGKVVDYLAYNFRFNDGEGVYEQVFTNSNMTSIISKRVEKYFQTSLNRILPSLESIDLNGVVYSEIDMDRFTQRRKYPPPGKTLGLVHDYLAEKEESRPVFTVGYFPDGIIIRATEPVLPVPTLLKDLQIEFPDASVDGGGHEQAGSIKYMEAYGEKVRKKVQEKLRNRKN